MENNGFKEEFDLIRYTRKLTLILLSCATFITLIYCLFFFEPILIIGGILLISSIGLSIGFIYKLKGNMEKDISLREPSLKSINYIYFGILLAIFYVFLCGYMFLYNLAVND